MPQTVGGKALDRMSQAAIDITNQRIQATAEPRQLPETACHAYGQKGPYSEPQLMLSALQNTSKWTCTCTEIESTMLFKQGCG
jgi:hypothetical protein